VISWSPDEGIGNDETKDDGRGPITVSSLGPQIPQSGTELK